MRESIERGIKDCKKCVLLLSENFLSNPGWTKAEFDAILARERIETSNLILPVWRGVSENEISQYSPILANRLVLRIGQGIKEIARELCNDILEDGTPKNSN